MTTLTYRQLAVAIVLAAPALFHVPTARAAAIGWNQTAAGVYDFNATSNWADVNGDFTGDINGIWDSSLTLAESQTITFAADTLTPRLLFNYAGNFANTLHSADAAPRTLSLGGTPRPTTAADTSRRSII